MTPLCQKTENVLLSCENTSQCLVAHKYFALAWRRANKTRSPISRMAVCNYLLIIREEFDKRWNALVRFEKLNARRRSHL